MNKELDKQIENMCKELSNELSGVVTFSKEWLRFTLNKHPFHNLPIIYFTKRGLSTDIKISNKSLLSLRKLYKEMKTNWGSE